MTDFERNARYSFDEKLAYLKQQGYEFPNIQVLEYKNYKVITTSRFTGGVRYYFYKGNKLVKMRHWNWKTDIMLYAKRYIDQELIRKTTN